MTLIEQIKADREAALKARLTSKYRNLTTLFGEASIIGKNANRETTDAEVVAVVKTFISNIDYSLNQKITDEARMNLLLEKGELDAYLPKQLDEAAMLEVIKQVKVLIEQVAGAKLELKHIMRVFKEQLAGQYDGKLLSEVAKKFLAEQV